MLILLLLLMRSELFFILPALYLIGGYDDNAGDSEDGKGEPKYNQGIFANAEGESTDSDSKAVSGGRKITRRNSKGESGMGRGDAPWYLGERDKTKWKTEMHKKGDWDIRGLMKPGMCREGVEIPAFWSSTEGLGQMVLKLYVFHKHVSEVCHCLDKLLEGCLCLSFQPRRSVVCLDVKVAAPTSAEDEYCGLIDICNRVAIAGIDVWHLDREALKHAVTDWMGETLEKKCIQIVFRAATTLDEMMTEGEELAIVISKIHERHSTIVLSAANEVFQVTVCVANILAEVRVASKHLFLELIESRGSRAIGLKTGETLPAVPLRTRVATRPGNSILVRKLCALG